jgi:SAM-dependent methyltransferase
VHIPNWRCPVRGVIARFMEDVSGLVARQYEGHPYPKPSPDLAATIADGGYQVGDPSLWAPMLWPEGQSRKKLTILVAGCGTMQAAWFAFTNRQCEVIGVDLSEASLAHQRFLQDKHALTNLRLFKGDLCNVSEIGRGFDLIVCTGVLHHLRHPDEGMRALADVLAEDGALACMVYGATRRTGVYMMQDVFRRLGVSANAEGIAFVRRTLPSLPAWHFVHQYTAIARELENDAALVDTFLHPQDRAYTVPQVLTLIEDNGLHFQGWFENSVYYPEGVPWLSPELVARVGGAPPRDQWAIMEMLSPAIATHYFFARKRQPPQLSFANGAWKQIVVQKHPGLRRTSAAQFNRAGRTLVLAFADAELLERANGVSTLEEIGGEASRILFERLWKQGHVMLSLTAN